MQIQISESFMKQFFTLCAFFILFTLFGCSNHSSSKKTTTINIIHMNDIHSHLDEQSIDLTFDDVLVRVDVGGYPRMATIADGLVQTLDNTILLNAGDALQGTLYYSLFKGEIDAKMMNSFGWDAFTLGNHEFDDGDANLENFINQLTIPIISANVDANASDILFDKWQPYIIKYFDGEAVGIIGIDTVKDTRDSSNPSKDISFYDEIITTQTYADRLASLGVDKIILLSHIGYENDIYLASQVDGVDVIVGGHSHTLLGSYDDLGLTSRADYPTRTKSKTDEKVCIVQAWSFTKVLGSLNVEFDEDGVVLSCSGKPILGISDNFSIKNSDGNYVDINSSLRDAIVELVDSRDDIVIAQKDTQMQSVLEEYKDRVDAKKKEIIANADETIVHIRIPNHTYESHKGSDYPLGSLVVPVVAKSFYERVNNSDLVILNAGAVRTDIKEGTISVGDIYTLLPFSNTLYSFEISGNDIGALLEDAISNYFDSAGSDGSFPYGYGLRYDIDMRDAKGSRVKNIEILDKQTASYMPIKSEKIYNLTTISYLSSAKDGYETLGKLKGVDTYFDYANSFVEYVKELEKNSKMLTSLPEGEHPIKSYVE